MKPGDLVIDIESDEPAIVIGLGATTVIVQYPWGNAAVHPSLLRHIDDEDDLMAGLASAAGPALLFWLVAALWVLR